MQAWREPGVYLRGHLGHGDNPSQDTTAHTTDNLAYNACLWTGGENWSTWKKSAKLENSMRTGQRQESIPIHWKCEANMLTL